MGPKQSCLSRDLLQHPAPYFLLREPCDLFWDLFWGVAFTWFQWRQRPQTSHIKQDTGISQKKESAIGLRTQCSQESAWPWKVWSWMLQGVTAGATFVPNIQDMGMDHGWLGNRARDFWPVRPSSVFYLISLGYNQWYMQLWIAHAILKKWTTFTITNLRIIPDRAVVIKYGLRSAERRMLAAQPVVMR